METKISVMITDPSDQFRDTLRTQLDAESDLEIVAEAKDGTRRCLSWPSGGRTSC